MKKKVFSRKRFPVIIMILVVLAAVGVLVKTKLVDGKTKTLEPQTAIATIRDLNTTITGSGPIVSSSLTNVTFKTNGAITKLNFKEGEKVKKGQILCTLDTSDVDDNIKSAAKTVKDMNTMLADYLKEYTNLNTKAPFAGQVLNIAVSEGDEVQKNGILYTIASTDTMKLTVPFGAGDISKISVGDKAYVNLQSTMQTVTGKVVYKSNSAFATATGGALYNVEIQLQNQGALAEGTVASVDVEKSGTTMTSVQTGTLEFGSKKIVKSSIGGTVEKINVRQYEKVGSGFVVVNMSNDDLRKTIEDTRSKLSDAKDQLAKIKEKLADYKVTAPIAGLATTMSLKVGDNAKAGDAVTTVTDNSNMEFQVTVDELDIANIKLGQKVNVTLDAISQTSTIPLAGEITKISSDGTSSNGVTTYPVTVKITGVSTNSVANMMRNGFAAMAGQSGTGQSGAGQGGWTRRNNSNSNSNGNGQSNGTSTPNSVPSGNNASSGNNTQNANSQRGNWGGNGTSSTGQMPSGFSGQGNFPSGSGQGSGTGRTRISAQSMMSQLKDGMNANAEIMVSENANVLTVPLEAIFRIGRTNYVMVQSDEKTVAEMKKKGTYIDLLNPDATSTNNPQTTSGSGNSNTTANNGNNRSGSNNNRNSNNTNNQGTNASTSYSSALNRLQQYKEYYQNAIPTEVQIGVNNDTYAQISSGLKEKQIVLLPPVTTGSSNTSSASAGGGLGLLGGSLGGAQQNRQFQNNNRNSSGSSGNSSQSGASNRNTGSGGGN